MITADLSKVTECLQGVMVDQPARVEKEGVKESSDIGGSWWLGGGGGRGGGAEADNTTATLLLPSPQTPHDHTMTER